MKEETLLEAAIHYAALGYPVFQCVPGGKQPLAATAPHGCKDATTERETIRKWWNQFPTANIGILAGNLIILDLDMKDGKNGVADLERLSGQPFSEIIRGVPVVRTPSGGYHLYYRCPVGRNLKATTGLKLVDPETGQKTGSGIDIRTGNTYVLAPPSIIRNEMYTHVTEKP